MTRIICTECEREAAPLAWRCEACGGPLDFESLPPFDVDAIDAGEFSLWRYGAMLPVEPQISLGEGLTPLIAASVDDFAFRAKLDYLNPTGSYKDRGTVTLINHLLAHKVRKVVEDSSGNAGASVAAYSSAAGLHARIYVPDTGSAAKQALIEAFGGALMRIPGPQHEKTLACQRAAETTPYASHAWSPYFVLGQMTAAWEIWEQMGGRAPDAIVTPVGHGGLFLGIARGFRALLEADLIEALPRMIAVQAAACDPIVRAVESDSATPADVSPGATIADGIIVEIPVRGREVLDVIRQTNGTALRVEDAAIQDAQARLARRGLIVEPTSATTIAARDALRAQLGADADVVIVFTGNGLKNVGR